MTAARRGALEIWMSYGAAVLAIAAATLVSRAFFWRDRTAEVVMIYLLGIVVVAMRYGYGPSMLAAVLSVALFDFLFVPPFFSFAVSDFQHFVTFGVMFFVAFVISSLTQRIRDQAAAAQTSEQRTASMYAMSRELAATRATKSLAMVAVEHVHDVFDAQAAVLLAMREGPLENIASGAHSFAPDERERVVIDWVLRNDRPAGASTEAFPLAQAVYVPLREGRGRVGVLGVMARNRARFVDPEQRALLDVFATQIASALARARLAEEAQQATLQMEAERLRSALLSSVSHDLRTPLSVITGSASALMDRDARLEPAARGELLATIHEEAERLSRLVRNLLDMTRLAAGALSVHKEWQPLDGIVGAALARVDDLLRGRRVEVTIPDELPPVPIDAVLIEQVLINLLENAAKHTPHASPISLTARRLVEGVEVTIADRGEGVPPELREKIFEKFFRGRRTGQAPGAGLGLAIARGIVEAHGGKIWVDAREDGGAAFRFTIPIDEPPPSVGAEDPT